MGDSSSGGAGTDPEVSSAEGAGTQLGIGSDEGAGTHPEVCVAEGASTHTGIGSSGGADMSRGQNIKSKEA